MEMFSRGKRNIVKLPTTASPARATTFCLFSKLFNENFALSTVKFNGRVDELRAMPSREHV